MGLIRCSKTNAPKMDVHWVRSILSIFILQLVKYICVSINDIIYHKLFYGIHNFDFTYRMFFFLY